MPYGFGGGLAAGFDSGVQTGTQIGEVRTRREALLQEQINEKIKLMQGHIDAGLKNLSEIVTNAPQRDQRLESTVQAYQQQLTEAAQLMGALGPQGEQASQMAMQTINNIVPSLKTQSEAFSAEKVGQFKGAQDAARQLVGGQQPQPVAAPTTSPDALPWQQQQQQAAAGPVSPGAAGVVPTAMDPNVPTVKGSGTAPMTEMAQAAGMSEEELTNLFLGRQTNKTGPSTAQKNLMGQTLGSAHALFDGLNQYESFIKEAGRSSAIPGTQAHDQAVRMRRGLQLQLKELMNLGVLNGPDLDLMNELIFDPTSTAILGDFEERAKNANKTVRDIITNRVRGVEAGIKGTPLSSDEGDATTVNEDGDTPEQAAPMPGSAVNAGQVPTFNSEEEAAAAGIPDGTRVIINGIPGTWRN